VRRMYSRFVPSVLVAAATVALTGHAGLPLYAQTPEPVPLPRFEVASVKPSPGPTGERGQPGRYTATRPARFFIADAFFFGTPLQMSRVLGGPAWLDSELYEITGNTPELRGGPTGPPRELFLMIRSLLQDRFKLKTHMETRDMPVYELVLARPDKSLGPQLRQATVDCDALIASVRAGGPPPPRQPNEPPPCNAMRGPARVLSGGIPMSQFANMLTFVIADANGPAGRDDARLVVDKTGLDGRFAFTLAWTPERMPDTPPPAGIPPIDPNGPALGTALLEQLGLKLQPATSRMEVVVIDSVERPSPD
jgi:uncharacterized protein (TIGR03435 family)